MLTLKQFCFPLNPEWSERFPGLFFLVRRQRRLAGVPTTAFSVAPMIIFTLLSAGLSSSLGDSEAGKENDGHSKSSDRH